MSSELQRLAMCVFLPAPKIKSGENRKFHRLLMAYGSATAILFHQTNAFIPHSVHGLI